MESFQNYLISEYKIKDYVAVEFKYNHVEAIKPDNKSGKNIRQHTILIGVKFYDKNLNLLHSANLKFVNNILAKVCEKKLVNIAPAELNNKFMLARPEIIKVIADELKSRLSEINTKLCALNNYAGKSNDNISISDEFKGELTQIVETPDVINAKHCFDM